jgi:hypothetical protein
MSLIQAEAIRSEDRDSRMSLWMPLILSNELACRTGAISIVAHRNQRF